MVIVFVCVDFLQQLFFFGVVYVQFVIVVYEVGNGIYVGQEVFVIVFVVYYVVFEILYVVIQFDVVLGGVVLFGQYCVGKIILVLVDLGQCEQRCCNEYVSQ